MEVHDTYRKDEKLSSIFEAATDEDVINTTYLDRKLSKIDDRLS